MAHIEPKNLVDAESLSALEALSSGYYKIPTNQRDYRWEEENWSHIWDDLHALRANNYNGITAVARDQRKPHFLGAVVVIRNTRTLGGQERGEIADGQQRMATLSILFAVLIKKISASSISNKNDVIGRLSSCLYSSDSDGKTWRLELDKEANFFETTLEKYLNADDPTTYWNTITDFSRRPVASRLKEAFIFFEALADDYVASESEAALENIATLATEALTLIKTTVFKRSIAYKLFETMNYRGLDLTLADLIKNKILEVSETQGTHTSTVQRWLELQNEIQLQSFNENSNEDESKKLREFLHLSFISCYSTIKLDELYDKVAKHLEDTTVTADGYTAEVLSEAKNLTRILNNNNNALKEASKYVKELRETLSIDYALPFVLAALSRFQSDITQLTRCIKAARDFSFRFFTIGSNSVAKLQNEIGTHSRMLRDTTNTADSVINSLRAKSPDSLFKSEFADAKLKLNKLGFYVMESIENHRAASAGLGVFGQSPSQHLEHILPKKPEGNWPHIDMDRHEEFLYRIGNLVALEADINKHIKNKAFSDKQSNASSKGYVNSSLRLPGEISTHLKRGEWTFDSIIERQQHLADTYILDVWPLA